MRRTLVALAAFTALGTSEIATAQRRDIPESERYVQLGTRLPPVIAGEGGDLFVIAPTQFCADAGFILELVHHPTHSMNTPAARMIAGPSTCGWKFEDMATGRYSATLHVQPNGPIVATGSGTVVRGGVQTLALSTLQTEVAGTLRVNGEAPPPGVHLLFRQPSEPWLDWTVSPDEHGAYRVALDANALNRTVCVALQRDPPLNSVSLQCQPFGDGLQRLDFDATMPRGVLRIEVPPVPDAAYAAFVRITISDRDDPNRGFLTSFNVVRGLRGDYIADLDRDYRIIVSRSEDKTVVVSARVTPTAERPERYVRLPIESLALQR